MLEVPERYSSGDVKQVVVCIRLNLSSCRRYRMEVISHEAMEQKRALREGVCRENKRGEETSMLMTLW